MGAWVKDSEAPGKREMPLGPWGYVKELSEYSWAVGLSGESSKPPSVAETSSVGGVPSGILAFSTYPGNLSIQESMKHTLVSQDRVAGDTIEERLEHSLSSSDHDGILFGLALLNRVISDRVLGRYRGDYESRVELDEVSSERLELGIAMACFVVLRSRGSVDVSNEVRGRRYVRLP